MKRNFINDFKSHFNSSIFKKVDKKNEKQLIESNEPARTSMKTQYFAALFLFLVFIAVLHTQEAKIVASSIPTAPPLPTVKATTKRWNECVLGTRSSGKAYQFLKQYTGNINDACLPGTKSSDCKTWQMLSGIILKSQTNAEKNCKTVFDFLNQITDSCDSDSQAQFVFPESDDTNSECSYIYKFNTSPLRRATTNFNYTRALIKNQNDSGREIFNFLEKIVNCVTRGFVSSLDGAVLNIFTDLSIYDLCSDDLFESSFSENVLHFIKAGYIVKFIFIDQNLKENSQNIELVLPSCKYNKTHAFCEINDKEIFTNTESYAICTAENETNSGSNFDYQLLLIIGIPCLSLTICCLAICTCCLKCAKMRMALMRLRLSHNPHHDLKTGHSPKDHWFQKLMLHKEANNHHEEPCAEMSNWPAFSSANHYMDIHALSNKKDVWEIDPHNLLIKEDQLLGSGAFSNVYKGILKGRIPLLVVNLNLKQVVESENDGHYEAAIKKLPPHADEQNHLDFFHEIEFMKRLGHHPHVISMLGCVSNPYDPLIAVEYCERGDLLKFLRRHKDFVLANKADECPIEADICVRIKDLVSITWQVADGMSYLASKNFIHRDLAARNILLTKRMTAKISDFGLCRYMDSALYTAKGGRLPIKWMSIEALKLYEFSTKSDVWSFGVLLFEIFSLGDVPYPTVQQIEMLEHLQSGKRLSQPIKCPNEIYSIMERCWLEKPEDRPDINEIRGEVAVLLNLDDESYGYLAIESDTEHQPSMQMTMQTQIDQYPESYKNNSERVESKEDEEEEDDNEDEKCKKLNEMLTKRFGGDQAAEMKQIFCEIFPAKKSVTISESGSPTFSN